LLLPVLLPSEADTYPAIAWFAAGFVAYIFLKTYYPPSICVIDNKLKQKVIIGIYSGQISAGESSHLGSGERNGFRESGYGLVKFICGSNPAR
jgi:hypothetical protein